MAGNSKATLLAEQGLWQPFFSPDGTQLFAVCGAIREARLRAGRLSDASSAFPPPQPAALTAALPPRLNWAALSGDELVLTSPEGVQFLARTNLESGDYRGERIASGKGTVSPDGRSFWRVTNFRDTALYDRNSLEPILPLPPNVLPLALSGDGRRLAVSVDDQRVQVWDLVDLRERFRVLGLDW